MTGWTLSPLGDVLWPGMMVEVYLIIIIIEREGGAEGYRNLLSFCQSLRREREERALVPEERRDRSSSKSFRKINITSSWHWTTVDEYKSQRVCCSSVYLF
jgi:hypothetical protein